MTKIITFKSNKDVEEILTKLPKYTNHSEWIREAIRYKSKDPLKGR